MLAMLLSIVFSVVPAKYRGRALTDFSLDVQRGALISSLLQMIGSMAIIIFRYPSFAQARALEMTAAAAAKGHDQAGQAVAIYAGGVMGVFEYLLHPLTFILTYFAIEGAVRLCAYVASNQILPSFPLQIAAWAYEAASGRIREKAKGPRIVDVVKAGHGDEYLLIESCRPKKWDTLLTISYKEQMYELESCAEQFPPRPFIYRLRRIPPNKLIRGIHLYRPEETLDKTTPT